ncbi:MAG: T9SS type A sorting domain-containing protein [Bacteroidales bacterium]
MKIFLHAILFTILPFIGFSQKLEPEEIILGETRYDLQSNASCPNHLYLFDDGTIGSAWTFSADEMGGYFDRGTGYNYYNGTEWGEWPLERLESMRSGWGNYAPLGSSGELVISHLTTGSSGVEGLTILTREQKGTGIWQETIFTGPENYEGLLWPKMTTGGENHQNIYIIALTKPLENGGQLFNNMNGALLYSKSSDQGQSWDIINHQLFGMDSSFYSGFKPDCYAFAEPKDNVVAFVVGSYVNDLFLMKSVDCGQTFTKTIIWDHPYDMVNPTFDTDSFYAVDGAIDITIDQNNKAHVVFGIIKTWYSTVQLTWKYDKMTDGVGYWNEDHPVFSSNKNSLNPYGHPDSELIPDKTLIGWTQDIDGDSIISFISEPIPPLYYYFSLGLSSMPQIVCDELGRLFFIYSSYTENYHNGWMNYRRLWLRTSLTNGQTWEQFYHYLTGPPYGQFSECVYPSLIAGTETDIYFTFMTDVEPGIVGQGSPEPYSYNTMVFVNLPKDEVVGVQNSKISGYKFQVDQNFPNPFSKKSTISVNLAFPATLILKIYNPAGQLVYQSNLIGNKGRNTINVSGKDLQPGIYFYNITAGDYSCTKKMVVR